MRPDRRSGRHGIALVVLFAAGVALGVWWFGTPPPIPDDSVRRGSRFYGVQRALDEGWIVLLMLPVTAIGSVIAIVAAARPNRTLVASYMTALFLTLVGALSLLRYGWWSRAFELGFGLYAFAPWIALGCGWIIVAGVIVLLRRHRQEL